MKTTLKQLAAGTFIAFILLAGNVKTEATEAKTSKFESNETALSLEDWMTDETIWNTKPANMNEYVQETDTDLLLEDWMTSGDLWDLNIRFFEETEAEMMLENWMINSETWNTVEQFNDSELKIECWMIDRKFWK